MAQPSNIAIFDIDGTLAQSLEVDDAVIAETFKITFGIEAIVDDWSAYEHSTDSFIFPKVLETHFGRPPREDELARVKEMYFDLLEKASAEDHPWCKAMPGAQELLDHLNDHDDWAVGIATGSLGGAAVIKLREAELNIENIPLSTADDALSRSGIIQTTLEKAKKAHGVSQFAREIYVGDGVWDLRAARNLGFCHLGRQVGTLADALYAEGARDVVPHFEDTAAIMTLLETITPLTSE